jgi:clan AA aspartic protease (TIGR02281 family)
MRFYYALVVLAFPVFFCASSLSADLFRWVDENGVVHFTDNLHNIPQKHRGSTTRIKSKDAPIIHGQTMPISRDKVSVPFQRKGEIVIIQATVNEKALVNFVVDTGASYTMISQAIAKELDIDLQKKLPTLPFQTANGIIQAPLISLNSVDVGGMQVRNLTAAVHDAFPDSTISGLLGLNFLSEFRMDIDTKNGVLHLEKK